MKTPHLLRVEKGSKTFAPLLKAAQKGGLQVGWLELAAAEAPASLEKAAARGVLRAVAAGKGRTVAVKPVKGEPVLKDLLREHFLGCSLVLVRGKLDLPRLTPEGEGWQVTRADQPPLELSTDELLARLRKPHPFE